MSKNLTFLQSFRHAIFGIIHTFKRQKNFKRMVFSAITAIVLGLIFHISSLEWFLILWSITTVLIAEMVNTTTEYIIDLIHKRKDLYAKLAKDVAAGAVLIASIWAFALGIVVFLPKIIQLF